MNNNIIYIIDNNENNNYNFDIDKDTIIYNYSINSSFNININLVKKNVNVKYISNLINYNDNIVHIIVNHKCKNTNSYIINHGVNVNNNKLLFYIDGIIPKNIDNSNTYQDSSIINLKDGKSKIYPNLLIENYNTISEHSCYIGKFKDEDIFYLKSRGINEKNTKKLLLNAFLNNNDSIEKNIIDNFIKEIDKL